MPRRPATRPRPATAPGAAPRANRHVPLLPTVLAVGLIAVGIGIGIWRSSGDDTNAGPPAVAAGKPVVGGDLHAVTVAGGRRFVSGHGGAAYSDGDDDEWTAVRGLEDKDGMAWAVLSDRVLVGGHEGLYVSTDNGATFSAAKIDLPVTDVHALGGSEQTVYLASPGAGMFKSTDAGLTFAPIGEAGRSFMGTILVDPDNPDHAIAPDMASGVAETTDGGRSWRSLGGPQGTMSVGWDLRNRARLVAVGMGGVALSNDGGRSWQQVKAPAGTAAATFDGEGRLLAAILVGDRARVERSTDSGTTWSAE